MRKQRTSGQVEELLQMTEQMQDELDQKDQMIMELNRQLNRSLTLNEIEQRKQVKDIEALRTKIKENRRTISQRDRQQKEGDIEVVAWKFRYEKAEQAKRYAQIRKRQQR